MNRFIQTYYGSTRLPNYYGYIHHSLLPLETALAPLLVDNHQLNGLINLAKSLCRIYSTTKLTKNESAAICLYTIERSSESLHHVLNQALNSEMYTLVKPWFGFLKLFITALEKLPTTNAVVWCGINIDIAKNLRENDEITWLNFGSCSLSSTVIRSFLDGSSILCSIDVVNGKRIRDFAYDTTQDEVLLLPGTHLRVKGSTLDHYNGEHILHLVEISNENYKTTSSSPTSAYTASKLSNYKSGNPTASHVSTVYMLAHNPPSTIDQSENGKEFSAVTFENNDRYEVAYRNGKKLGYGVYFTNNEIIYDGLLAEIKAKGRGKRTWTNGDRYEGNIVNGMMYGSGTIYYRNGYVYKGNWIADEPHEDGMSTWPNGNCYEGHHERGKIQGRGTFFSNNKGKYEGDLIDGKAHGRGVRTWSNGDQYEGAFRDDKKHGFGTYYYTNGGKYTGNWTYDEMNGEGLLQWPSRNQYKGNFKDGKRHGLGKLTFANGQLQDGLWDNDKYIC